MKIIGLSTVFGVVIAACNTTAHSMAVPAVLLNPNADTHAELTAIVTRAVGGAKVLLAKEVLTTTSILIIERAPIRSINNNGITRRGIDRPDRFTLSISKAGCFLTHEKTNTPVKFISAQCAPEIEKP